jgi:hypothetical protein
MAALQTGAPTRGGFLGGMRTPGLTRAKLGTRPGTASTRDAGELFARRPPMPKVSQASRGKTERGSMLPRSSSWF